MRRLRSILATNTSTWNSVKNNNNLALHTRLQALTAIGNYVSEGYSVLVFPSTATSSNRISPSPAS